MDYINPRPKPVSCALPPEVRAKLGLRSSSEPPPRKTGDEDVYVGAANAAPKVGASGAGTNWHNPNGHAFVKRGSGVPMSERASRKAQLSGNSRCTNMMEQMPADGDTGGPQRQYRPRANSRGEKLPPLPPGAARKVTEGEDGSPASGAGGGYAARNRPASRERAPGELKRGKVLLRPLPAAPERSKSVSDF